MWEERRYDNAQSWGLQTHVARPLHISVSDVATFIPNTTKREKKARPRALHVLSRVRAKAMNIESTAVSVVPLSSGQSSVPRSQNTVRVKELKP